MNHGDGRVGMRVYFGRANGEKTLGEIIKINPKKFKVKQLETRGSRKVREAGTIWTVPPVLCTPAGPQSDEDCLRERIVDRINSMGHEELKAFYESNWE